MPDAPDGSFDLGDGLHALQVDPQWLVLDKPSGMLSVPGRGPDKQDCAVARAQSHWPDALVVHRLDMATSGLLLLARGIVAQRRLNAAFAERQVYKRYQAVVAGNCTPATDPAGWHLIDLPIAADWPRRPLRIIDALHGQPSQTRWRCLGYDASNDTTRLDLEPLTGRSHQLRVHLQAIGHPIVGDALYAPAPWQFAASRLLLHACALSLIDPWNPGYPLHWESPVPF